MGLLNPSLTSGATVTVSGGTTLEFNSLGNSGTGKTTIYAIDDSDIRTRRDVVFSSSAPKVSITAPNGYTQSRGNATLKFPLTLENGKVTVNTVRLEVSTDVETNDTEKLELRTLASQILTDPEFVEFWDNQSVA